MLIEVLVGSSLSAIAGFLIAKKIDDAKYDVFIAQAQAKAKVIEHEAEMILKNAKNSIAEKELEIKKKYDEELLKFQSEYERKELLLEQKEKELNDLIQEQIAKDRSLTREFKNLEKGKVKLAKQKEIYDAKMKEAEKLIERGAGLTKSEAKNIILEQAKLDARAEMSHIVRKAVKEAERNAKKEAFWIISQATTRFAGEFASERLTRLQARHTEILDEIMDLQLNIFGVKKNK
jgi:ribonuclease Y